MVASMEKLTLDEQYIVGRMFIDLDLRKEELNRARFFGMELRLPYAVFARRCLIGVEQAKPRLELAARSLLDRTYKACYPLGTSKNEVNHLARWFDSLGNGDDEITLHLCADAMVRILSAMEAAPAVVEESESMMGAFMAGTEVIGAALVQRARPVAAEGTSGSTARAEPPIVAYPGRQS